MLYRDESTGVYSENNAADTLYSSQWPQILISESVTKISAKFDTSWLMTTTSANAIAGSGGRRYAGVYYSTSLRHADFRLAVKSETIVFDALNVTMQGDIAGATIIPEITFADNISVNTTQLASLTAALRIAPIASEPLALYVRRPSAELFTDFRFRGFKVYVTIS